MNFFLGTHKPHWLREVEIPLLVSRRTLAPLRKLPRALGAWSLDSGGFSELSLYHEWRTTPAQYLSEVKRFSEQVGNLEWAAVQDYMCEPFILAKTGLTVAIHQERTIDSYLVLTAANPSIRWLPVLQGYSVDTYWRHWQRYEERGISLESLPTVGLGSICRRQGTGEAVEIIASLASAGLRIHGFGFKQKGIESASKYLASTDSLAWSYHARRRPPIDGCSHKSCANCQKYALWWRERLLNSITNRPIQESLLWQLHGTTSLQSLAHTA